MGGYHDYDHNHMYYVGTPYKIAPLRLNTSTAATSVSEGTVGDIRYVMSQQRPHETQFFIDPVSKPQSTTSLPPLLFSQGTLTTRMLSVHSGGKMCILTCFTSQHPTHLTKSVQFQSPRARDRYI